MIIFALNSVVRVSRFLFFFAGLFLLLLVKDECFMAPQPLAHGLDAVTGALAFP